jgi:hypothetical protein
MLEEVCEPRTALLLARGAHVVPDVHGDEGERGVAVEDDL